MKTLYVYYEAEWVGTLWRQEELTYAFQYDPKWCQSPNAFALSLSLPLGDQVFANKATLSFFENLLPEGDVRLELEQAHQIQGTFDFLEKFGRDVAGAVVLSDDPNYRSNSDPKARVAVDMSQIYQAIAIHKPIAEAVASMNPGYLSLAGAQDKFAAILGDDRRLYLPTHGAATTHIVKAPIWRHGVKESVYNEYFCMELARQVGLNVPKVQILDGEFPLFVVERYDRTHEEGKPVRRLHQQDFCQAQGYTSEFKYEIKGGPTLKNNYDLLLEHTAIQSRAQDVRQFFNWLCFNLLIGNNDSHSKNLSLLAVDRKLKLAPFYDLMSTSIDEELQRHFAFAIGGRRDVATIGRNQFETLEEDLGLKTGTLSDHLRAMAEELLKNQEAVAERILKSFPECKVLGRITDTVKRRWKGFQV